MRITDKCSRGQKGVTLMELIFVMAIIAVLASIAVPSFMSWRRSLEYRTSARDISLILREARSRAITTNRQFAAEIDTANGRYRLRQGSQAYNSTWGDVVNCPPVTDWARLPLSVKIAMVNVNTPGFISFFPNGTSSIDPNQSDARVEIRDSSDQVKYKVRVLSIGSIKIGE